MVTTIRILPESLTNKIAAGEVVERPASVVKELVENALDAGSSEVTVEIESGGKRLIKVSDTGCGMSREDALLALERHATSKIASDDDLFELSTLGFRGEALPSIASVSRLTVATRVKESVEGTEIYAEGGRIKEVKGRGMAAGTVISIRNLFFNTPARLKFMRSSETEGGHVGDLLTRLAISRPEVRFTYLNDGKTVFRVLNADLKERVAALLGRPIAASLFPLSYEDSPGLRISGLVSAPQCNRSAATHLYTYINGRFIKDKVVQHAVMQAYRNFLERGRYPVVALFIEIAPGEVDVNVHPTKHEVRFREQTRVHDAIQGAVEGVLRGTPWIRKEQQVFAASSAGRPATVAGDAGTEFASASVAEAPPAGGAGFTHTICSPRDPSPSRGRTGREWALSETPVAGAPSADAGASAGVGASADRGGASDMAAAGGAVAADVSTARVAEVREVLANYTPRPQQAPLRGVVASAPPAPSESPFLRVEDRPEATAPEPELTGYFSSLAVLGQYNAAYILCQEGNDLILVDQHAAHERVAFERLKGEFFTKAMASQGLLFPETVEFSFKESAVLKENSEELARLGYCLEEFGGNTWLLNAVPEMLAGGEYLRILRDILEELGSLGRSRSFGDIAEDILSRIACHSVVRGRSQLSRQEIVALFRQMDATDFSSNCPHGRPVMQKLTLGEVEKMFKR